MLMTIRYQNGLRAEAVVLTADNERMRVVIDSQRDTMELRKVDACWYTEDGAEIEIEALIPLAGTNVSQFCAGVYPRANAAGRSLASDLIVCRFLQRQISAGRIRWTSKAIPCAESAACSGSCNQRDRNEWPGVFEQCRHRSLSLVVSRRSGDPRPPGALWLPGH